MSDFDPTTNRIPFGLLSEDEQTALIHWPHGFEFWWEEDGWDHAIPCWDKAIIYRGKPAPAVTSKRFNVYPDGVVNTTHTSREKADKAADNDVRIAVLRIDICNGVSTAHLEEI